MDDAGSTTFSGLWDRAVEQHGARPFLQFESAHGEVSRWTYDEFDNVVAAAAGAFLEHGVTSSRGVHLAVTNTPSFVAAWLGAVRLGSHIVPSDPMATAPELAEHLRRTVPAVGLRARTRASVYDEALAESGLGHVTTIDVDEAGAEITLGSSTPHGAVRPANPSDRAAVMFTSGTTGRPKGVVITQANYAFAGSAMAEACGLTSEDRQFVVLPLFHANAQYYSFASAIAVGASVALMHTFSASRFIDQAARHDATHASLFAGPMRMILARGGPRAVASDPPLQLRHCWFAQNLAEDQYETISTWFGCRPRQLYGMTETIPAVLTDRHAEPRPDIMGTVTPGCSVDVVNSNGETCAPNEVGEIVVGGRRGVELFAEYLDDPGTTDASFDGEWFHTGDRAWRDHDGRFHFDGRRADVLKVSGENVSVVEVEAVLSSHPLVLDAVVVGAPDPIRDEVPVAFIVPAGSMGHDGSIDEVALVDELTAWCTARLAKAKRPHRYVVVDELPRTSVGKIRKFLLTEAASRPLGDQTPTVPQEVSP